MKVESKNIGIIKDPVLSMGYNKFDVDEMGLTKVTIGFEKTSLSEFININEVRVNDTLKFSGANLCVSMKVFEVCDYGNEISVMGKVNLDIFNAIYRSK